MGGETYGRKLRYGVPGDRHVISKIRVFRVYRLFCLCLSAENPIRLDQLCRPAARTGFKSGPFVRTRIVSGRVSVSIHHRVNC